MSRSSYVGDYVDATGTHRRLQSLVAIGYSLARLSAEAGHTKEWAPKLLERKQVERRNADKVAALFERLCMTPAPRDTPARAEVARRSMCHAAAKGWPPPLAWDDIDADEAPATPEPLDPEFVDEVAVLRAFNGDTTVHLTAAERREFVARWLAAGRSYGALADDYGYKVDRYLERGAA